MRQSLSQMFRYFLGLEAYVRCSNSLFSWSKEVPLLIPHSVTFSRSFFSFTSVLIESCESEGKQFYPHSFNCISSLWNLSLVQSTALKVSVIRGTLVACTSREINHWSCRMPRSRYLLGSFAMESCLTTNLGLRIRSKFWMMAAWLHLLVINISRPFFRRDRKAMGRYDFSELRSLLFGIGRKSISSTQNTLKCWPQFMHRQKSGRSACLMLFQKVHKILVVMPSNSESAFSAWSKHNLISSNSAIPSTCSSSLWTVC